MMRLVAACLAACVAASIAASNAAAQQPASDGDVCAAPLALGHLAVDLPKTRAKLMAGLPVKIVTLGSSSTAGAGASAARFSYPSRLAVELAQRRPGATIQIVNRGMNGEDAWENFERLERDVIDGRPDLVIWQMGTNAILRDVDYDDFDRIVQKGLDRLTQSGIEVVLMDLQYAPRVIEVPDHRRMLDHFDSLGARNRVAVFHRYAVMKHWADAMKTEYVGMISSDGLHLNDRSYGCLAQRLADAIVDTPATEVLSRPVRVGTLER